jgi:hypothetical protein
MTSTALWRTAQDGPHPTVKPVEYLIPIPEGDKHQEVEKLSRNEKESPKLLVDNVRAWKPAHSFHIIILLMLSHQSGQDDPHGPGHSEDRDGRSSTDPR